MQNSIIQYILDKHICLLDANKQKFSLYKCDIDIIKNFKGFKILDNGTYWYKGHDIIILDKEATYNAE